jgi:hypothetical protein
MATTKSAFEPKPRDQDVQKADKPSSSKRDHSGCNAVKSPRRSKSLKLIACVKQQSALNGLLLKSFTDKQTGPIQVTSKENEATPLAASSNHSSIVDTPRSSITEHHKLYQMDTILCSGLLLLLKTLEDIGLDGSENDHQHSGHPLSVPWGNKAVKNRRNKSYSKGRKCDRKTFSKTLSSIFDYKFLS